MGPWKSRSQWVAQSSLRIGWVSRRSAVDLQAFLPSNVLRLLRDGVVWHNAVLLWQAQRLVDCHYDGRRIFSCLPMMGDSGFRPERKHQPCPGEVGNRNRNESAIPRRLQLFKPDGVGSETGLAWAVRD
jgi:hypothetical protein